jgi:hypothetical protein
MLRLIVLALGLVLTLAAEASAAEFGWPCVFNRPVPSCQPGGSGPVVPGDVQPASIRLEDANGKQIGKVVGTTGGGVIVALLVNGQGVLLFSALNDVHGGEFPLIGGQLGFESQDCSGAPLLDGHSQFIHSAPSVAPPGLTLYLPIPGATPVPKTWRSAFTSGNICGAVIQPSVLQSVAAAPAIDFLTVFTPPFRLTFTPAGSP